MTEWWMRLAGHVALMYRMRNYIYFFLFGNIDIDGENITTVLREMKREGRAELKWLLGPFIKPSCSTNTGNFVNGRVTNSF
jgi:hypothetical protein